MPAAFFAVLHGPAWMFETFVMHQKRKMKMPIRLAEEGLVASAGVVYLAPGDRHLSVDPRSRELRLTTDPPENYVRPSADPLFRSIARAFGRHSIAVVLTGMGRDGSIGAEHIAAAGGVVIAQDPATCVAPSMPQTVLNMGVATETVHPDRLAASIAGHVERLSVDLAPAENEGR
jgi:two-component system chemotaxis response regulator CheB